MRNLCHPSSASQTFTAIMYEFLLKQPSAFLTSDTVLSRLLFPYLLFTAASLMKEGEKMFIAEDIAAPGACSALLEEMLSSMSKPCRISLKNLLWNRFWQEMRQSDLFKLICYQVLISLIR